MKFVDDGIVYLKDNKYGVIVALAILYTLYEFYKIGVKANESRGIEGYENEKLRPANIDEAIKSLKKQIQELKMHCIVINIKANMKTT